MKYTEFENLLRQRLWEIESNIDSDNLLDKILSKKSEKKIKLKLYRSIFILLTLFISIFIALNQKTESVKPSVISENAKLSTYYKESEKINLKNSSFTFGVQDQGYTKKHNTVNLKDYLTQIKNKDLVSKASEIHSLKELVESKIAMLQIYPQMKIATFAMESFRNNYKVKDIYRHFEILDTTIAIDILDASGPLFIQEYSESAKRYTDDSNQDKKNGLESLPLLSLKISNKYSPLQINEFKSHNEQVSTAIDQIKKNSMSIIFEVGVLAPFKNLETKDNPLMQNVLELRETNEHTLEGIQAGIFILLESDKIPLFFKTGISYSRIYERMIHDYEYTKIDTIYGITSISTSLSGDTLSVLRGEIYTEFAISGQKIKHHNFQLFDIPVNIGMNIPIYKKWAATVEGGMIINARMISHGQILTGLYSFSDIEEESYRMNLGLGYNISVSGLYALSKNNHLGLSVRWSRNLKAFTSSASQIQHSYKIPGIHLSWINQF